MNAATPKVETLHMTEEAMEKGEMHTKHFIPQVGDVVYLIHELYERMIVDFRHYFVPYQKNQPPSPTRSDNEYLPLFINPWLEFSMEVNDITLCTIVDIEYQTPNDLVKYVAYA